ncbi:MAG: hypothetical protein S4CHLAM7_14910 [Chlamydiae bacterium]|nr:hypothetical protein [Chlamydiota bacterium]
MIGFSILSYLGISVFAISGALKGIQKELDYLGVFVAALLTAIGGGAIRDILLGQPPEFIHDAWYFVVVVGAVLLTSFFRHHFVKSKFVVYLDAIGLATFSVLGAAKGIKLNEPIQAVVMVGLLSGIGGGLIRDILLKEIPMVLKGEFYATAALLGIGLLILLNAITRLPLELSMYISVALIATLRSLAYRFGYKVRSL